MSFKAINVRERWYVLDSKEILDNFQNLLVAFRNSLRMNFTKKLLVQVNQIQMLSIIIFEMTKILKMERNRWVLVIVNKQQDFVADLTLAKKDLPKQTGNLYFDDFIGLYIELQYRQIYFMSSTVNIFHAFYDMATQFM